MHKRSIAFHHFGCKVNFAEASSLTRQFSESGYELRNFKDKADVYVISSCAVTAVAEKKCRAAIRQAHRLNPGARIAVIGCLPELNENSFAGFSEVDLVLGHTDKFTLHEKITELLKDPAASGDAIGAELPGCRENEPMPEQTGPDRFIPSYSYGDRTRSFLKVQDGCDYFCAYCTIPFARGRSRSDTIEHVVKSAREIVSLGSMEIILTGVNIGDFGRHNGESLFGLIKALEQVDGLRRIRISSVEPDLLGDEIIRFVSESSKFQPHFHIPLQSGSDRILNVMKRKYNRELFRDRIMMIRELMPQACIASDVIAGFPGETPEDFRETYAFLEDLPLSYLHVFSYSKREKTLAAKMDPETDERITRERSDLLHKLSAEKKRIFYKASLGTRADVLFESDNKQGYMHGFTGNYISVRTPYRPGFVNTIRRVTLAELREDCVYEALVEG